MEPPSDSPQFWFLGAFSVVATTWAGIVVVLVVVVAFSIELLRQREVRSHLRVLDRYLPAPTDWQLSVGLVRYNVAYSGN